MRPTKTVNRGVHYIVVLGREAQELIPEVPESLERSSSDIDEEGLRAGVDDLGMEVDDRELPFGSVQERDYLHESLALAAVTTGDRVDLGERETRVLLSLLFHPGVKALHAFSFDDDVVRLPLPDELPN